ncbi:hypothetical protein A9Q99_00035 [Gammaproteobacteria bacterium 45_16_T64]|nr:hypothetical protein A9Q99_00035 [Gammaproteobacteria bacterium 45_16_T64]
MFGYCYWVLIDSYNKQTEFYDFFSKNQQESAHVLYSLFSEFNHNHIKIYDLLRQFSLESDEEKLYNLTLDSLDSAERTVLELQYFKKQFRFSNSDEINENLLELITEMQAYNKVTVSALKQASVNTLQAYEIMAEAGDSYVHISNLTIKLQDSIQNQANEYLFSFNKESQKKLTSFIVLGVVLILAIFILSVFFVKRFTNPLLEILANIRSISSGDSEVRCKIKTNDEVGAIAREVNALADNLDYANIIGDAKSLFLASMSHEIRTPLNGIVGISELLLSADDDEDVHHYLELIHGSAHSLMAVINDILDFSKIEAGELKILNEPFDLFSLINELFEFYFRQNTKRDINIVCDYPKGLHQVFLGDSSRIRQILSNLMSNALKFTDEGRITLAVNMEKDSGNICNVNINVSDTGCGLDINDQKNVFKNFYQSDNTHTKHKGTGLGLSISRRLAELMGGSIALQSDLGKGSTFSLQLELVVSSGLVPSKAKYNQLQRNYAKKVLLAEDDIVNQKVAAAMLDKLGLSVDIACNGLMCVEMHKDEQFDLILMDIHMPEMDGLEATREIRKLEGSKGKISILALTASVLGSDQEQCEDSGMDGFIAKPLRLDDMVYHLDRYFL